MNIINANPCESAHFFKMFWMPLKDEMKEKSIKTWPIAFLCAACQLCTYVCTYLYTSVCRYSMYSPFLHASWYRAVPPWQTPSAPSWWRWWTCWTPPPLGTCAASSPMNWRNQTCMWMTWSWPSYGTLECWTSFASEKRLALQLTHPPTYLAPHTSDTPTICYDVHTYLYIM